MAKKDKRSREQKVFDERMKKQLNMYGFFNGEFLEGTEVTTLDSDPKIENVIKRVLKEVMQGQVEPSVVAILKKQVRKALVGDVRSAEFLFDRAYGKPQQSISVATSAPVINIEHSVVTVDELKNKALE